MKNGWIYEKRAQLWQRLSFAIYILVKKLLYQQGYILVRGEYRLDMLKWPQDPEYYSINRKNNIVFFIRISEYKAYESKSSGLLKPICDSPLKYIYRNNGEDITQIWMIIVSLYAEFSRSVLDPDPEYCLNKIIYCPVTMHAT